MKCQQSIRFLVLFCFVLLINPAWATNSLTPLAPLKTDNPRDTMRTFMSAMADYKKGMETKNPQLIRRIDDAARCFNLDDIPFLVRSEKGREAAIFLKEVIDRIIVIDYNKIPEASEDKTKPLLRWRLRHSEIVILRVEIGERAGEYLFSKDTTSRVRDFYEKVKHLPYQKGSGQGALYSAPWIEQNVPTWAKKQIMGIWVWQWLGLFFSILIGLGLKTIMRYFMDALYRLFSKSRHTWDNRLIEVSAAPTGYLIAVALWYGSLHFLRFEGKIFNFFSVIFQLVLSAASIWLVYRLVEVLTVYLETKAKKTESTLDDQLVPLLNRAIKIFTIIIGVLIAIQNLGINVVSLMAGLGIGGLAFALAAKDMVANLFGSIMILLDRPFQVGDWIIVSGVEGTVQEIGFRSTRLRTFYNSVVSIPNSELANTKIDNMGMREFRRVRTFIGITYDTPAEKIEAFLEGIKKIIQANPYTRKDYFHTVFHEFSSASLNIMLYFFLKVPDWSKELVEKQNVFLEIIRLAEALRIRFAFPTQTLHIETWPEDSLSTKNEEKRKSSQSVKGWNVKDLQKEIDNFGPSGTKARPGGQGIFIPPYQEELKPTSSGKA